MHLPFSAAHAEINFWDLRWKKWCRLCRWLALWVCLLTFAPMAARSPVNSPSRSTSRVIAMVYGRMVGGQVRRVCAVSITRVTVSLWENYIGFALSSLGQGPLGPLCQRDEVYIEPTLIILWMRPVCHPFCALFSSAHASIWAFNILPARRYAPLVTHVAASSARDTSFGHLRQHSFWGFAAIFDGSLFGPSPHVRRRIAHVASVLAYLSTFDIQSRPWLAYGHLSRLRWAIVDVIAHLSCRGLSTRKEDVTRSSHRRDVIVFLALAYMTAVHSGKRSSPSVSVGCAASPSISENTGESPREYLIFCVVFNWALVSGVFSNSPSLCVFGAITTISLGEETKLENGNLESDHFRWAMLVSASSLVDRFGHQGTRSSKRRFMYTFPLPGTHHATVGSIVGEQQERGCPFIDGKIFLVSSANYAFVHTTQSSLDARFLARRVISASRLMATRRCLPVGELFHCGKVGLYEPARRHHGLYALPAFRVSLPVGELFMCSIIGSGLATAHVHMYYL
ncbi:hypothetical protein EDB84DRAFT_1437310 [Lactarius hengduanensis]|nr:hypothetical protein EDB84DRAFT_1437310 [Lactarius hengduanensis]